VSNVRAPIAAGRFYPAGADDLGAAVDRLLAAAAVSPPGGELRAVVVPHAGYVYSGAVAARAFALLARNGQRRRIALLGPSHFVPLRGAAVSAADTWRTPLGPIPVDARLRDAAVAAGAIVEERPHRFDHALEVELPFLQRRAEAGLRILPVAVDGDTERVASLVDALADDAVVVVSSDLSHYLDDATARAQDERTAHAIVELDDTVIDDADACGAAAVRGLLAHARRAGWTCTLLGLRTSADATGDRSRVVGYGAFALTGGPP